MKLRKTTRLVYCQLPNGASATTFKRASGATLQEFDFMDIYVDVVWDAYFPYMLYRLDMLREVDILDEDKNKRSIYVVVCKDYNRMDYNEMQKVVEEESGTTDPDIVKNLMMTIVGMQYVLHTRTQFEVNVIVVEGNSLEAIAKDKIENGEHVTTTIRARRKKRK